MSSNHAAKDNKKRITLDESTNIHEMRFREPSPNNCIMMRKMLDNTREETKKKKL
jgi:hypothetical protein